MKKRSALLSALVFIVAIAVFGFMGSGAMGQEHPKEQTKATSEHPQEKSEEHPAEHPQEHSGEHPEEHSQEHPAEHPVKLSTVAVSNENLAAAIRSYIDKETKKHEGVYVCMDDKTGKKLDLTLKKVHDDKLATLENNTYFACADFKASDGKVYDIDIFMTGKSADELVATEIAVHKENGVERYTWAEIDGVWHKVKKETKEKIVQ